MIEFSCQYCGVKCKEYPSKYHNRKRFNCKSPECVKLAKSHPGIENGMFGKTHSKATRNKLSELAKNKFSGKSYEELYGKEKSYEMKLARAESFRRAHNEGKIPKHFLGKTHNEITKKIIGKKSAEKFTEDYREKYYYSTKKWIRPEDKSDWEIYQQSTNWKRSMWNLAKDVHLVREHKIFNPKSNPNGCVRDHIISRKFGFDNKVFPEILTHPENCQILRHKENSKKQETCGLTIDELFDNIENTDISWPEQDIVVNLIQRYRSGERWERR